MVKEFSCENKRQLESEERKQIEELKKDQKLSELKLKDTKKRLVFSFETQNSNQQQHTYTI